MGFPGNRMPKGYLEAYAGLYAPVGEYVPPKAKKPKVKLPGALTEAQEQTYLVHWMRLKGLLVMSIPNQGRRSYWQGQKEVSMGLLKGACDLLLAEPNRQYGAFFIEMKARGQKPRPEQLAFMEEARKWGYRADWYDNWEKARDEVEIYLQNRL